MSERPHAPGDVLGVDALDENVADEADVDVADENVVDVDVVEEDVPGVDPNRAVGGVARSVLEYMARQIVDEPDAVVIEPDERGPSRVDLRLHVAPDDMGKIIGRRGRVAQAIRTVVRAVGAREGVETTVDIVD